METYLPQIIACFDPLMKVAAKSYKSGIGWLYSTCRHQGRLVTAPFDESLRIQAAKTGMCFLVLSIPRKIADISCSLQLFCKS